MCHRRMPAPLMDPFEPCSMPAPDLGGRPRQGVARCLLDRATPFAAPLLDPPPALRPAGPPSSAVASFFSPLSMLAAAAAAARRLGRDPSMDHPDTKVSAVNRGQPWQVYVGPAACTDAFCLRCNRSTPQAWAITEKTPVSHQGRANASRTLHRPDSAAVACASASRSH